jgi:hypothetical protein
MANGGREISFPTDTEEKARLVVHFYEQIKLVETTVYTTIFRLRELAPAFKAGRIFLPIA